MNGATGMSTTPGVFDPSVLQKYVTPLPRPTRVHSCDGKVTIRMVGTKHSFHPQLPLTHVWFYNGLAVPMLDVQRFQEIHVKWVNELPRRHLLQESIDHTIMGAEPNLPNVRTAVHLHGGEQSPFSDGGPLSWFTPETSFVYRYPNQQLPTMLMWHDHCIGITRLNVYAGLTSGVYIIRDPKIEAPLRLPKGKYEIPLVISDKSFREDNQQLFYPIIGDNPPVHPKWTSHFIGTTILVNNVIWPVLKVQARKYRFRMVNAANTRFFSLKIVAFLNDLKAPSAVSFWQIGSDGGYLPYPVELNAPKGGPELLLGSAERADIIIDFSRFKEGTELFLVNSAVAPFEGGKPPDPNTTRQVMKFIITPLQRKDKSKIRTPKHLFERLDIKDVVMRRQVLLTVDLTTKPNALYVNNTEFMRPVSEFPVLGTTELWEFINLTPEQGAHPMHIHLIQFQILNRQAFRAADYLADFQKANAGIMPGGGIQTEIPVGSYLIGDPISVKGTNEDGWKDTVISRSQQVTRLLIRWAPQQAGMKFPFDATNGQYVNHCHLVEHEDNDMMRPYQLLKKPGEKVINDRECNCHID